MWHFVFPILLGFAKLASTRAAECPPSSTVFPCTCSADGDWNAMHCENVDRKRLISVLQHTKGRNMSYEFWNSDLGEIPSGLFEGQHLVRISFYRCQIESFGDRPFSGLEDSLVSLYISDSVSNKDFKSLRLGHLGKLQDLGFQGNEITRVGNDWFEGGPSSLKELMLEANDIEELGDRAFASLVNLEQLWMGNNLFKKVQRSMFPNPANKLKLLEISDSEIEEIPEDIFEGMPALYSINLQGNKLKTLPETTWGKVWDQLEEVYLDRNYGLICDENIEWVYKREKLPKSFTGECTDKNNKRRNLKELSLNDFQ